ncbi:hypothetical protein [Clostridioides difficile]|uniref:hypothetical protein n=1 Tax=Clostridioides difficile TaxID=1496 RepID=UPI001024E2A2|nr:hypothetical protein [Clostridioides difficile]EIS9702576.1 hypothetical protein [Clostridioides difficile]EIS9889238.1 hypothetical protein [Clostridioides difficile]MBH6990789.1 hypothetical protein [Clostridioides difficile]MBH7160981.1 hypothetical protein [Clostridioides difficile]MBH8121175.1 hypothetical protein [Clostridioides difficile]
MAKFVKKPVEVEAFKFDIDVEPTTWIRQEVERGNVWVEHSIDKAHTKLFIRTLEGKIYQVNIGDYIIQGVKGEIYPCKADIFEMIYEKVEYRGKNKLSTKMTLDSTNFQENIKNAAKELEFFIETLEKADDKIDKLTKKMNKCACKVDTDKIVKQLVEHLREGIE